MRYLALGMLLFTGSAQAANVCSVDTNQCWEQIGTVNLGSGGISCNYRVILNGRAVAYFDEYSAAVRGARQLQARRACIFIGEGSETAKAAKGRRARRGAVPFSHW